MRHSEVLALLSFIDYFGISDEKMIRVMETALTFPLDEDARVIEMVPAEGE